MANPISQNKANHKQQLPRPRKSLLRDGCAMLLLWGAVIVFFWRIALAGRVLAAGDAYLYFYPYWAEATRALRAGRLPLWNPYLFMGVPFLANSQTGVLYPLNWALWLILPPSISLHISIVLHLCLAALTAYAWARECLRLGVLGAWTTGAIFALGGYLGAQVEHVNQLQGLAWMPLALLLAERTFVGTRKEERQHTYASMVGLAVTLAATILAGHTQTAFITITAVLALVLGRWLWGWFRQRAQRTTAGDGPGIRRLLVLLGTLTMGVLLAGIQLVPMAELARLSIRAGGLPFKERISFSLTPFYLARALLPPYTPVSPAHMEHVAYVGIAGLILVAWGVLNRRLAPSVQSQTTDPRWGPAVGLTGAGLLLAMGGYNPLYLLLARFVPGFAHFRVPARWLAWYALGMAGLVGCNIHILWTRHKGKTLTLRVLTLLSAGFVLTIGWAVEGPRWAEGIEADWHNPLGWIAAANIALLLLWAASYRPRLATFGMLALLLAELYAGSLNLPHARATAPQAFTGLRPAIAHLRVAGGPADRFLSVSDITFDPGDLGEIEVIYGPQLSPGALYDYVISAKLREMLSPNLPLAFKIPAVDGYDGGVLPLARYVALQHLFLPAEEVALDGRLRENLRTLPPGRWLNLFRVRFIVTDKLRDAWLDDVFYDLQFGAKLKRGQSVSLAHLPAFEATAIGFVSHLEGASEIPDGIPVGTVEVNCADGVTYTFTLRAGEHTAEGIYTSTVQHSLAPVGGHFWPGKPEGNDYVIRLRWDNPAVPQLIRIQGTLPKGDLIVRGLSLIDERTGSFQALVISDQNRLRLVHSGDVKIYENLDVLPRAFVVHRAMRVPDATHALAVMRSPDFDPATEVVIEEVDMNSPTLGYPNEIGAPAEVHILREEPEHLLIQVHTGAPGYLVVTDAWYPGWSATVNGRPVEVEHADILFRAVHLESGDHLIALDFRPASLRIGVGVTMLGCLGLVGLLWAARRW